MLGKIARIGGLIIIVGFLLALITFNASHKPPLETRAWDARTTMGPENATKHYIMYTDLACPYCDVFSRLTIENKDEFEQYLNDHGILFEVRVTDFLYEFGEHRSEISRAAAEATYCATELNLFWEYYHGAIMDLWNDYHSKGIGTSKTSPEITGMTTEYWTDIARKIPGITDEFWDCYYDHDQLEHVKENTARAAKAVQGGMPYFQFGQFTTSGFDQSWGWDYVLKYLDAGL